jgi:hypothetical protein
MPVKSACDDDRRGTVHLSRLPESYTVGTAREAAVSPSRLHLARSRFKFPPPHPRACRGHALAQPIWLHASKRGLWQAEAQSASMDMSALVKVTTLIGHPPRTHERRLRSNAGRYTS